MCTKLITLLRFAPKQLFASRAKRVCAHWKPQIAFAIVWTKTHITESRVKVCKIRLHKLTIWGNWWAPVLQPGCSIEIEMRRRTPTSAERVIMPNYSQQILAKLLISSLLWSRLQTVVHGCVFLFNFIGIFNNITPRKR